jgi:antitoxin component YwqK of YwqJK toxin-antitoxin module
LINIKNIILAMNLDILPNEIIVIICGIRADVYAAISQLSWRYYALTKAIKDPKKWFSVKVMGAHYEYSQLPNGDLHGAWKEYYDGKFTHLKSVRHYNSGQPCGVFVDYGENNTEILRGEYLNGLYHGRMIYYRADGSVCCVVNYQNGVLDGPQTYYYENGTVHNYYVIKHNKYTVYREYLPDGTLNHQFNS